MKCSLLALSSYLDDEMEAGRRAEVEAHLVGCERCRKGMDCLREETESFDALGRLHVPDGAVHAFLQQLGLIGSDDVLPPRPPRPSGPARPDLPPWLGGGDAGRALPWAPRHEADDQPNADQPSLPFTDAVSPPGLTATPRPSGESPAAATSGASPDGTEIDLSGRSVAAIRPAPVPTPPPRTPGRPGVPQSAAAGALGISIGPAPTGRPAQVVALQGVASWPAGRSVPAPPPGTHPGDTAAARLGDAVPPHPAPAWPASSPSPRPGPPPPSPPETPPETPPSLKKGPPPPPASPAPPQIPPRLQDPHSPPPGSPPTSRLPPPRPPAPPWPAPSRPEVHSSPADGGDPWRWAPRDGGMAAPDRTYPAPSFPSVSAPAPPTPPAPSLSPGAPPAGARRPGGPPDTPDRQGPDAIPAPPAGPLTGRVAHPPQAVRPTLIARLRDQVALRLALMRGGGGGDGGDEPVAGPPAHGERHQPPESVGPLVAAMRTRGGDDPDSDEPAGWGGTPAAAAWSPPDPDRVEAPSWLEMPFRRVTTAEELPRPPRPRSAGDLEQGPRAPGRHTRRLSSRRPLGSAGDSVAQMAQWFGDTPDRVRRLAAHPRRRWLALVSLVALVAAVSLVISRVGGGSSPSPTGAATGTTPSARATPTTSLPSQHAGILPPAVSTAPSSAPTVSATAAPSPTPPPAAAVATYGAGGTGWQLADIQYADHSGGHTWIVFDLSGTSASPPSVTVSSPSSTTLIVTFSGTSASGTVPITAKSGAITGVTRQPGAQLAYQVTLAKPLPVATDSGYAGQDAGSAYPLHLILDLG